MYTGINLGIYLLRWPDERHDMCSKTSCTRHKAMIATIFFYREKQTDGSQLSSGEFSIQGLPSTGLFTTLKPILRYGRIDWFSNRPQVADFLEKYVNHYTKRTWNKVQGLQGILRLLSIFSFWNLCHAKLNLATVNILC